MTADVDEYITRVRQGEILTDPAILVLKDATEISVALAMINTHAVDNVIPRVKLGLMQSAIEHPEVMRVRDAYGIPLIERMSQLTIEEIDGTLRPYFPINKTLLTLTDRVGTYMAMVFAELGHTYTFPEDVPYMNLRSKNWPLDNNGMTVAEQMVKNGYHFSDAELLQLDPLISVQIGRHRIGVEDWIHEPELLARKSPYGTTLAHTQAKQGYQFDEVTEEAILLLKDKRGIEVAWVSAEKGQRFSNPTLLGLTNRRGKTLSSVYGTATAG